MKEYIFVINPVGAIHEVDKERLPDLLKQGYQLTTKAPDYRKNLNYVDFNFNTTSYNFDGYGRISAQWQKEIIPNLKSDTFVFLGPPAIHDRKLYKKQILFTMFEADKIPKEWIVPCNKADYIIVPSDFCIKVFKRSGVKTPIVKVKLGIDESSIVYPKKEPFIFGHQNALMKDYRKGWDVLYKAFINVFGDDQRVKLLLKGRNHGANNDRAFVDEASTHKNIEIIEKDYTYPELYNLFWKRINVFVFPSRGEGFSLPPLEAMAKGIPAIITNAHSHTEYIKYAIPLKTKGTCRASYEIHINVAPVKGLWVEPDQKDLERLLIEVYKNYDEYKKQAIYNVKNIEREYQTSVFIKNLIDTVKDIQSLL